MYSALVKIFSFADTLAWGLIVLIVLAALISGLEIASAGGWHAARTLLRVVQP